MARYTGPKNRLARSLGRDLGLTTNPTKLARRIMVKPGVHGPKGSRRKMSDYGIQLKEKQKAKWIYGILEKQFRNYYIQAKKHSKNTGARLLQLLESRLDNIVYRLHLAPTRTAARQFVTHGHVTVNGKKVNIPSYQVSDNDVIAISAKISKNPVVMGLLEDKKYIMPAWLEKKATVGKVLRTPQREELDSDIQEQLIVEHYSR
jgi:small subunit ribosomal protein S4